MKHRFHSLLFCCLLALGALPAWGKAAAPDPAAAGCARQLQRLHRALLAHRRDHQRLPDHLSGLWPRYVRDPRGFVCPADGIPPSPGHRPAVPDPRLAVSYSYEMGAARTSVHPMHLGPAPAGATWRAQKLAQRVNFGDRVPVIRCWHHARGRLPGGPGGVWNLTLSGQVYESSAHWELDPETVPVVLACMERDAAAGWPVFRRRWEPDQLSLYFSRLHATPSLRARLAVAADRIAACVGKRLDFVGGEDFHVVELLYRAANDPIRADMWREHGLRRLPDGAPLCG